MEISRSYLGDGVYAAFDGYHCVLTTGTHVEAYNVIYLEPRVLVALDNFVKRINDTTEEI